jgi:hypothetical protein
VAPNKWPAGYQAGFLVARRDPTVLEEMLEIIREGNYTDGWNWNSGWGQSGYGGWIGAMAMQGNVIEAIVVIVVSPCLDRALMKVNIPHHDAARRLSRVLLRQDSARYRRGAEPMSV